MKTSFQAYRRKREAGQALVETAIVYPVFIFMILGIIQLTMLHQCRLMMEYAAFNAARTGAVWNGNKVKMRRAATLSLIATRPTFPGQGKIFPLGMIKDYKDLIENAAVSLLTAPLIDEALGMQLIKVDILSPKESDFSGDKEEIDFDDFGSSFDKRRLGQLSIRLTYFYKLSIPFANWVIWNSWFQTRSKHIKDAEAVIDEWNSMVDTLNGVGIDLGLEKMHKAGQPFKVGFDAVNYANDLKMVALMFEEADSLGEDEYAGINSSEWRLLIGATMGVLGMPREY